MSMREFYSKYPSTPNQRRMDTCLETRDNIIEITSINMCQQKMLPDDAQTFKSLKFLLIITTASSRKTVFVGCAGFFPSESHKISTGYIYQIYLASQPTSAWEAKVWSVEYTCIFIVLLECAISYSIFGLHMG